MDNVFFSIKSDKKYPAKTKLQSNNYNSPYIIYEDDSLNFFITAPVAYGKAIISLQDFRIETFRLNIVSDYTENYEYETPKERHFANFFGQSEIIVSFENIAEFIPFHVEILATKITAEQAKKLLDYLSKNMSDVLRVCFSKTRQGVNYNKGQKQDVSIMLIHAENGLKLLSKHRNQFKQKKITLLKPRLEIQKKSQINTITNNSILWIFNNLDKLYPVSTENTGFVQLSGRIYDIEFIENESLHEDTDIYENRLILSYLYDMKDFLNKIKKSLENQVINHNKDENYFKFEEVLGEIKESLFLKPRIYKCDFLIKECNQLIHFINNNLPCTLTKGLKVKITPAVKVNQHYKQLFLYIYEWQNFGEPNWQSEKYLYGLRTLWKLYEFFCLYELINGLLKINFILEYSENRKFLRKFGFEGEACEIENNPNNFYSFKKEDLRIELYYEPNIWTRTEYTKKNDVIDIFHNGKSDKSCFSPDFLLKIYNREECVLMIFDAKYSKRETVREFHLPKLIKKYLHGINVIIDGNICEQTPVQFLYALHPTLTNESVKTHVSFHNKNYGLFSDTPIKPIIGAIALNPDKDSHVEQIFDRFFKFIL